MSDRIILSVTTVQKTQNRKTLSVSGGGGGGAVPTPHFPLTAAVGQLCAAGGGRGAMMEGAVTPHSRRQPPLRRQNDAVQTPVKHGYSFNRPYTGLPHFRVPSPNHQLTLRLVTWLRELIEP